MRAAKLGRRGCGWVAALMGIACGGPDPSECQGADCSTGTGGTASTLATDDDDDDDDDDVDTTAGGTTASTDSSTGDTDTDPLPPAGLRWDFEAEMLGQNTVDVPLSEGGAVEGSVHWQRGQRAGAIAARGGAGRIVSDDGHEVDFGPDDSFRIELTFRSARHGQDGTSGQATLVHRGAPNANGFAAQIRDGHLVFSVWSDGVSSEVESPARVVDDRWHRISAIRDVDRGQLVLVVDGYDVASAPDGSGDLRSDEPLVLLAADDDTEQLWGGLDDVAILPGRVDAPIPTPQWDDREVFAGGVDTAEGFSYAGFRIPAIVRTDSGTLVAFAEGRVDDTCDFGRIHIVSKRSTDGGDTWSPLQIVATMGTGKAGNPIPIADGDRIALMVLETPCTTGTGCSCNGTQQFSLYLSDDEGQTWSDREEITADVTEPGWGGVLLGPGSGIRLERGPSAGTLVVTAKHGGSAHLLTSDDHGETWTIAAQESTAPLPVNETTAAELSDGRILVNARYQQSLAQEEMDLELGFRHEGHVDTSWTYSDDPTFSRTAEFRGPVVHGALLYRPGSERFGDEARLLFSFPSGEFGTNAGRRHDIRIYTSRDDGETWARSRRMIGGWAAYSDLVDLADGRIGMLYEGGHTLGPTFEAYRRVHLVRARPEWLDHASLVTYAFEDLAVGDPVASIDGAGGWDLALSPIGTPTTVAGEHHSTAVHLQDGAHLCTGTTNGAVDFEQRDSFALEVTFRTTAHVDGGTNGSGALLTKTAVGTTPAWWLRVEDGQIRFLMAQCPGLQVNCGLITGACASLGGCSNIAVQGGPIVSDGQWHHVRIVRDAEAEMLTLELDGAVVETNAAPASGIAINEEPLCVGAFAGGSRAFEGDIDDVRIELL